MAHAVGCRGMGHYCFTAGTIPVASIATPIRISVDTQKYRTWPREKTVVFLAFAIAAIVDLAAAYAIAASPEPAGAAQRQIWESSQLIAYCFIGATFGTIAKIAIRPSKELASGSVVELAWILACKASVSMACGLMATPMLIRYLGWTAEPDSLVAMAAAVAFMGDATLIPILVSIQQRIADRSSAISGEAEKRVSGKDKGEGNGK